MNISIELISSKSLESGELNRIAAIASAGFERHDPGMIKDSKKHVEAADYIQLVRSERAIVGFSLYSRCLWRA